MTVGFAVMRGAGTQLTPWATGATVWAMSEAEALLPVEVAAVQSAGKRARTRLAAGGDAGLTISPET